MRSVLGTYPTPVEKAALPPRFTRSGCELWVKRDDRTGSAYGGNKVRKLEYLIADAKARGATRLVTIGAVGSHHVLATAIYGRAAGLAVDAVLVPQPRTDHVATNIRAALGAGLHAHPVGSYAAVPFAVAPLLMQRGSTFIPLGGSSVVGSMGYVDAARELVAQVEARELPEPDLIVVTLGSGGTAAGLAAGLARSGMRARVLGVCVSHPWWLLAWMARRTARACAARDGQRVSARAMAERLLVDKRYIGEGYGYATEAGARAMEIASAIGLLLDPTYTAKAFAAALDRVEAGGAKTVLYWHTLSSASLGELTANVAESELAPRVQRLLRA